MKTKFSPIVFALLLLSVSPGMSRTPGSKTPLTTGKATFFTYQSCLREGTSGITASGKLLVDAYLWCALPKATARAWNIKYGANVQITNLTNGHTVIVKYMDRGPGRKSRSRKVIVDLTQAAFLALGGDLKTGRLSVKVNKIMEN